MSFRSQPGGKSSEPYRRFKPPPDYTSRRVQFRLLMLVGLLMLVVVAAEECRDPKYYRLFFTGGVESPNADEPMEGFDSSLTPRPQPADPSVPDAIRTQDRRVPLDAETVQAANRAGAADPLSRSRTDAWASQLDALNVSEQVQLRRVIYLSRSGQPLSPAGQRAFAPVLDKLKVGWKNYLQDAANALSGDSELVVQQQEAWGRVLRRLEAEWTETTLPAFEACFQNRHLSAGEVAALEQVQVVVDRLQLAAVKDNTVLRNDEQGAWFRLWEQLASQSSTRLAEQSEETVSFLQLYRQPDVYRGKLVTVRGEARLGYRVDAPHNIYGIEQYNILWIKPRGGPNTPLVVYALETPPGFPPLSSKTDEQTTTLAQDVAVTGYFFKNWAYRSKGGINVAPLLLAKSPTIIGGLNVPTRSPAPWRRLAIVASWMAALAVFIACGVYWIHNRPNRASQFYRGSTPDMNAPGEDELRGDIRSTLAQLEKTMSQDENSSRPTN